MHPIALQLYTIREEAAADFLGTLRRVADIGYDGVEYAGLHNTDPSDIARVLQETGLKSAAAHLNVKLLEDQLDELIPVYQSLDCNTLICPGFWVDEYTEPLFHEMAALFNRSAEKCEAAGMRFGYHIHGHEFVNFGDKSGMDILANETDAEKVLFEPDIYWIERAGVKAQEFVRQYADRCHYIHLKDAADRNDWTDTEVGKGAMPVAEIIQQAAGMDNVEWLVIEQEKFNMDRMESIAISYQTVKELAAT